MKFEKDKKRRCFNCGISLNLGAFLSTNSSKIKSVKDVNRIIAQWTDKRIELFCCSCYREIKSSGINGRDFPGCKSRDLQSVISAMTGAVFSISERAIEEVDCGNLINIKIKGDEGKIIMKLIQEHIIFALVAKKGKPYKRYLISEEGLLIAEKSFDD